MLPEASQARKAIWEAVNGNTGKKRIDEAFPDAIRSGQRDNDMLIRFVNGSTWQVIGSDNYNSLVGSPPVGVVFSEWALADPQAWAYLRPILAENDGWALFISTPRGRNHLAKMYESYLEDEEWYVESLPATHTGVFTPEKISQEKREYIREYGPDDGLGRFEQEYLCSFDAGIAGSFYGSMVSEAEKEGRITSVPYNPAHGVEVWFDLGVTDATAMWFVQRIDGKFHVIDYYESSGQGVKYYVDITRGKHDGLDLSRDEKFKETVRFRSKYTYSFFVAPHDAENKQMGAQVQTVKGTAKNLGMNLSIVPKHSIEDGIQAARNILPLCVFDKEKTERGLDCLRSYRRKWDEKNKVYQASPLHDFASHASDAFRYGAMFKPPRWSPGGNGGMGNGPLPYENYALA